MNFVRRRAELLALEGWYDCGTYRFKFSCRFRDILRCSEFNGKTRHFTSCFSKGGGYEIQPVLRCLNPNWAVVYTPDKHGNFLGRAFVHWNEVANEIVIDKVYGNKLTCENIREHMIKINVACRASHLDTYLRREPA